MTARQRQVFRRYLTARRASEMFLGEPIWVALLLGRKKPGVSLSALVHPDPPEDWTGPTDVSVTVDKLAETFQLATRRWNPYTMDVARSNWWLDLLPTHKAATPAEARKTSTPAACYRRLGIFYGYPQEDIEHFLSTEPPYTQPEDLLAEGVFQPTELAFVTFIPQNHDDSIKGFERAIAHGKTNRTQVATLATDWELPELDEYAEWRYETTLDALIE